MESYGSHNYFLSQLCKFLWLWCKGLQEISTQICKVIFVVVVYNISLYYCMNARMYARMYACMHACMCMYTCICARMLTYILLHCIHIMYMHSMHLFFSEGPLFHREPTSSHTSDIFYTLHLILSWTSMVQIWLLFFLPMALKYVGVHTWMYSLCACNADMHTPIHTSLHAYNALCIHM